LHNLKDIPLERSCSLIHQDEWGVCIIDKSPGVLSHPNKVQNPEKKQRTLLNSKFSSVDECYEWTTDQGELNRFHLCHRLDSATSGIIVGCLNKELAVSIREAFKKREVQKTYMAITSGYLKSKRGTWKDSLVEKKINGKLRVCKGNGQAAITKFQKIRNNAGKLNLQLLELQPVTGRTHQLRVQCMLRNIPISGDNTYGDFSTNRLIAKTTKVKRLCLHASKIEFEIKHLGEIISINLEAPFPRLMGRILL
jgi:tRNA pseudouridine65 synthase